MDFDCIESLASEAIEKLRQSKLGDVLALLGEIKGHANALLTVQGVWDLVKEDYEAGVPPRRIHQKFRDYGVSIKEIYNRAHFYHWASPAKIRKAMKPATGKKNIFYPTCRDCEKPFEAYSGHAIICPTCKAYKAQQQGRERHKG